MESYLAILRGINVSGQKKVQMDELKESFSAVGFYNVRTYIQSGNVLFEYDKVDSQQIIKQIEQKIREKFGFEVPVLIRTAGELRKVIENSPFDSMLGIDAEKLHVTFLSAEPKQTDIDRTKELQFEPDRFIISGEEVYVYCPGGYGRTKLNNNFFEKKLKVNATTRNWKTVTELAKMLIPVTS
jgi:uncharacterized protein (DUF1697 family)